MSQWNRGLRGAKPRPAGLREAGQPNNHVLWTQSSSTDFQETIQAVHKKSVARWWDPQAGRPHFIAARVQLRVEVTSTFLVAYNTRAHLVLTLEHYK